MIGRKSKRKTDVEERGPKWFDDFDLRLGDLMRGERATLGKSLLDVQRELRIKASYIAAIENADPTVFDTPGFIAGYVRSYARYLGMDPDKAYAAFCAESGFATAHGMSAEASTIRRPDAETGLGLGLDGDALSRSSLGAMVPQDNFLSRIEPRAIGSVLVLLLLVTGIGFGGWTVLKEVQRVQVAPVENAPNVLASLDPLKSTGAAKAGDGQTASIAGVFNPPSATGDRLYKPQALDAPVVISRDAPISTLKPSQVGAFADPGDARGLVTATRSATDVKDAVKRAETKKKGVALFAIRAAWVRVRSSDGSVIFEKTMDAGEEFILPAGEEAPTLQAGMTGSLYFDVDGELYGPVGKGTATVRKLDVSRSNILASYKHADFSNDPELSRIVEAQTKTQGNDQSGE